MYEYWKIVGKDGVELLQITFEDSRISLRYGPASGFMTRSEEPTEAAIKIPNRETAEALATILRNTNYEMFKNAKVIRA
jgi:hypothetical protein